jgi:hypothetical protein
MKKPSILDVLIWISLAPLVPVVVTWWLPWEDWLPKKIPKYLLGPYLFYIALMAWHFAFSWIVIVGAAIFGLVVTFQAIVDKYAEPDPK